MKKITEFLNEDSDTLKMIRDSYKRLMKSDIEFTKQHLINNKFMKSSDKFSKKTIAMMSLQSNYSGADVEAAIKKYGLS